MGFLKGLHKLFVTLAGVDDQFLCEYDDYGNKRLD